MDASNRQAYANTFALLSQLFLHGPSPELQDHLAAIPDLAACLAQADAGAHYDLFGRNVLPFQGIFLHADAGLDGPNTAHLLNLYHAAQFEVSSSERPDHIGTQLDFLQHELALASPVHSTPADLAAFLDTHLLTWLAPFTLAVGQHASPCYAALADLTFNLLATLRTEFADIPATLVLPEPSNLLADPGTGLKKIAGHLLIPSATGIYLSTHTIQNLARGQQLPRGFGDRRQMLTNLLRNAAQYDLLADVLKNLEAQCQRWTADYQRLLDQYPLLSPVIRPWQTRAAHTRTLLEQMQTAMREAE